MLFSLLSTALVHYNRSLIKTQVVVCLCIYREQSFEVDIMHRYSKKVAPSPSPESTNTSIIFLGDPSSDISTAILHEVRFDCCFAILPSRSKATIFWKNK